MPAAPLFDHLEPVVDAALASLRADLNDTIDAVNSLYDDFAIAHVDPDAYYPGGLNGPSILFPFVEVSASDEIVTVPTVRQVAWTVATMTLIVCVWTRHVDDETLYRSQLRYGQATASVLAQADALGTELATDTIRAAYRRNPETDQTEQLLGAAIIVASLTGDER